MNQPTTYEQLIAQKLQELDVPDHASSIWATIEQQLNIEMPTDITGSGGSHHFNWWMGGGGLFTFAVAVVTYISVSKQNFENKRDIHEKPTIEHHRPAKKKDDSVSHTIPIRIRDKKTEARSEVPNNQEASSIQDTQKTIPPPQKVGVESDLPPAQKDTVVMKKPRGVKGLSDADYRLVPAKKDSVNRKN